MSDLFSPLTLRNLTLRNRVAMSPMCMYCAGADGRVTDWHVTHYLSRAIGGVGMIVTEATAVEPRGRISPHDLGLWEDGQIAPLTHLVQQVHAAGGAIGVQLAHAGRKAWSGTKGIGPERAVAPSPLAFDTDWREPEALDAADIDAMVAAWQAAARRAAAAGCDFVEIHGAHGYLIHEFLSPLANHRSDEYGGALLQRTKLLTEIVDAVRDVWPEEKPLLVRLSATDWVDGGLTVEDTVEIARRLKLHGVDLVDCSSGGMVPAQPPSVGPGYQVPLAAQVRQEAQIATSAVGLITAPEHADAIIRTGQADLVLLGRELLRHPYWPLDAARELGIEIKWPEQYRRGKR